MNTSNLLPNPSQQQTPQPTPASPLPAIPIEKILALKEFGDDSTLGAMTIEHQRQLLSHYNPAIGNLDDEGLVRWKHQVQNHLGIKVPTSATTDLDKGLEFIRPMASDAAGVGAGLLAGPETLGTASIPVGVATKMAVDSVIQHMESNSAATQGVVSKGLGLQPGGFADTLTNAGQQVGLNKLLSLGMGGLLKGVVGATSKFIGLPMREAASTVADALPEEVLPTNLPGKVIRGPGGKFMPHPDVSVNTTNRAANEAAGFLPEDLPTNRVTVNHPKFPTDLPTNLPTDLPEDFGASTAKLPGIAAKMAANKAMNAQNATLNQANFATNAKNAAALAAQDLKANTANKLLNIKNAKANANLIETNKASNAADQTALDKIDVDNSVIYSKNQENAGKGFGSLPGEFAKNVGDEFSGMWNKVAAVRGLTLPFSLIHGSVSPYEGAAGAYDTFKLGRAAVKTLLANPRTSRIIGAMINKEPLGVPQEFASKAITDVLQGSTMALSGPKGDKPVKLVGDKFVPLNQAQ